MSEGKTVRKMTKKAKKEALKTLVKLAEKISKEKRAPIVTGATKTTEKEVKDMFKDYLKNMPDVLKKPVVKPQELEKALDKLNKEQRKIETRGTPEDKEKLLKVKDHILQVDAVLKMYNQHVKNMGAKKTNDKTKRVSKPNKKS